MSLEDRCWHAFKNKDHEEAVRLLPLVEEPNKKIGGGRLLRFSSYNGWLDVTKDLITKMHCDPREKAGGYGWTCLHYATLGLGNHVDLMRYLIDECHCDPMAVDRDGWTPLHWAANWGKSAAVEYLLSTGKCDPLAKNNNGNTPFKLAKEKGHSNTLPVFKMSLSEDRCLDAFKNKDHEEAVRLLPLVEEPNKK